MMHTAWVLHLLPDSRDHFPVHAPHSPCAGLWARSDQLVWDEKHTLCMVSPAHLLEYTYVSTHYILECCMDALVHPKVLTLGGYLGVLSWNSSLAVILMRYLCSCKSGVCTSSESVQGHLEVSV